MPVQRGRSRAHVPPRTALERQLCDLWRRLLRVPEVGITDDFFDLGGHSVLAVRLFAEVEKLTGHKLPLVTLFQAPTIEGLSRLLGDAASGSPGSLLVPIQPQGSRAPLFLVHGAGGDVLWGYANLAGHLGSDQPVYGIKSRGQAGLKESETLEEMAAAYVEEVRNLQPAGPYYLGGYCFGGNVAYEMARQLAAKGEEVALVALLDTAPANAGYEQIPWWQPRFWGRFARNLGWWLADFRTLPLAEQRRFVLRKARVLGRRVLQRFRQGSANGADVDLEEVIETTHFPERELRLWRNHVRAFVHHRQHPYDGSVTLLRTRGQPLFCSLAEDFCWGKLARGGVEVRYVPGSHEQIFMEPNVRALAQQLRSCLVPAADRAGIIESDRKGAVLPV
jgi:thioesterase domain-containing protein